MRKIVLTAIALAALLISATVYAGAQFKVLAPAEESFVGMDQILIIGKVEGFNEAKMVEISSNGKAMGLRPCRTETSPSRLCSPMDAMRSPWLRRG